MYKFTISQHTIEILFIAGFLYGRCSIYSERILMAASHQWLRFHAAPVWVCEFTSPCNLNNSIRRGKQSHHPSASVLCILKWANVLEALKNYSSNGKNYFIAALKHWAISYPLFVYMFCTLYRVKYFTECNKIRHVRPICAGCGEFFSREYKKSKIANTSAFFENATTGDNNGRLRYYSLTI